MSQSADIIAKFLHIALHQFFDCSPALSFSRSALDRSFAFSVLKNVKQLNRFAH